MVSLTAVLPSLDDDGNLFRRLWDRFHGLPGGDALIHLGIRWMVPYTGLLGARIVDVRPGFAKVVLEERWAVRNHLDCIHAVALANLCELAGNVGVMYALPDDARFIVKGIDMRYHAKARGRITAISEPPIPTTNERQEFQVTVRVLNDRDETVCTATLHTLVGPKRTR